MRQSARPRLGELAAGTRLLLIVPNDASATAVRQSLATDLEQSATIVHSAEGDFIACQEAELLEVRKVAAQLINNRRDFAEIAQRLHTRIDIHWDEMPLDDTAEPPQPAARRAGACPPLSEVTR